MASIEEVFGNRANADAFANLAQDRPLLKLTRGLGAPDAETFTAFAAFSHGNLYMPGAAEILEPVIDVHNAVIVSNGSDINSIARHAIKIVNPIISERKLCNSVDALLVGKAKGLTVPGHRLILPVLDVLELEREHSRPAEILYSLAHIALGGLFKRSEMLS